MGARPEKAGFRCPDPEPRAPGVRPLFLGDAGGFGSQALILAPFFFFSYPPPNVPGAPTPLPSPRCWKISLPRTLSKSSKFSDRIIFQLPEKLGMVAALGAVPLDPSAGALDAESFSQKICGRRLRLIVRRRKKDTSQDNPEAGLGSRAGSFYTLCGPAPAQKTRWPLLPPRLPPHLGGPEPWPCVTATTPWPPAPRSSSVGGTRGCWGPR